MKLTNVSRRVPIILTYYESAQICIITNLAIDRKYSNNVERARARAS